MFVEKRFVAMPTRQFRLQFVRVDAVGAVALWANEVSFHGFVK